jgi:hypothetical protein
VALLTQSMICRTYNLNRTLDIKWQVIPLQSLIVPNRLGGYPFDVNYRQSFARCALQGVASWW